LDAAAGVFSGAVAAFFGAAEVFSGAAAGALSCATALTASRSITIKILIVSD
jgi:hypothetical protein